MRKVSKASLDWARRAIRSDRARRSRQAGVRRSRRYRKQRYRKFSSIRLRLPSIISLSEGEFRSQVIQFIRKMKDRVASPEVSNVIIDFSRITMLHPCGTLLFVAELERLFESPFAQKKLSAIYPVDRNVEQMFQHIKLLERLGLPPRISEINASNVLPWLYASGHEGDLDSIAEKLPKILTEGGNMEIRLALMSGMAEAVANSSEHAYLKQSKTPVPGSVPLKWWLFARQSGDDVSVVICDLGLGIPGTLEANWREELGSLLKTRSGLKRKDHKMIELALTVGKTSTNKVNRGKGLKDILKVVRDKKVGEICIFSNRGVYSLDSPNDSLVSRDERNSINGTIVQWKIPIEALGFEVSERL
ncbi:hypothetical protein K8U54_19300 [Pseudomonas fulva]|uniref:hypothetical protein n=1 Tax=Pseudomonas fulva TaxID=47880 RepID=UPI00201E4A74|nr:hypothetical protein [Pseudomonas fulva]UQY33837.1 hypothetical protein K8U54_19300 [Pseudomonas fulva]